MCRGGVRNRYSGFFSIDAAFALLTALIAFISFHSLLVSAASSAQHAASSRSSELLALRFSSDFLNENSESGSQRYSGSYYKAWELDASKLEFIDLGTALKRTGKAYAKVSIQDPSGTVLFEKEEGQAPRQVFCAKRLALLSGRMVLLEACIS